ncbi:MAG: hypothetical protein M3443_03960 [Actinomycetota bacterium]|nr:hypothetical protein [Actinomycetota bacterium]
MTQPAAIPAISERPPAVLPLPNALAFVIAGISVCTTLLVPLALGVGDRTLTELVAGYYLHSLVLFTVLGALILHRRPGHAIGWLLVAIGGFDVITRLRDLYELFGLAKLSGFPTVVGLDSVLGWAPVASFAGMAIALPQLFPDGRPLSRRWRPLLWFGAAASALLVVALLTRFVLLPQQPGTDWLVGGAFALFASAMLVSMVPLAVRYRRSRGVERQQLKWVFYGLAVTISLLVANAGLSVVAFNQVVSAVLSLPAAVSLPVTITVAVLRYRLYDIDVVISRTLLVAGLAVFITVAYVAIVVGVGSLVGGGDEPNLALSVVATAVVAVAFQPVRRRLQRVANRLVFGRRATPYDVLSGFATRVGAAEPSPDTLVQLAELMAGGTGADPARVWLRVGSQLRPAATWPPRAESEEPAAVELENADGETLDRAGSGPALPDADLAVPVRDQGELLGMLTIAKPRGERVTEVDVELLGRLAAASGVVLRNLRLDAELAQRLTDLEASRRRLLNAQNDARQRIEGELAGGTRAQLGVLRERLSGLVREINPDTTPKSALLLGQLVAATDGAMDTLDGLAAGVYPPRLAADGLVGALNEQAAKAAVPVNVHASGLGRYSAEVEAAVYFSVLEALQNVAKYAGASSAQVRLRHDGDRLRFEVTDDGAGFDPATMTMGTGLQGMADRLDTVGGAMTLDSTPGTGTTVLGIVPFHSSGPATADISELVAAS